MRRVQLMLSSWLSWCLYTSSNVKTHAHDYAHLSYFALVFVEGHGLYRYCAAVLAVMTFNATRKRGH